MYLVLSRDADNIVIHVQLPATPEEVRNDISQLDEYSAGTGPVKIINTSSRAKNLTGYIKHADLGSEIDIKKLSQLAEQIDSMGEHEQHIFSGALDAESINGLDDVLRVASSLDQYEFIKGVTSDKELGGWLVEHGQAGVDFPEAVRPYLDYAGIGAEYYANHGGAYTPNGYVKRREMIPEQAAEDKSRFALTLISASGSYRINLPASDDELEQARQALRLRGIGQAILSDAKIDYPWAHLLPLDSIILADANALAQHISTMSETELRTFGAALEVEEMLTFSDADYIAENIDDYELVCSNEGEYGREALRYAGAGDEILDMLDDFTDFDALGRFEMEQDGVRETSFGQIKRLSSPFPQQTEQGQAMC